MNSVSQYIIVDSRRMFVENWSRTPSGDWQLEEFGVGDTLVVPSLGQRLGIDEIYEGVTLPPMTVREEFDEE
jgi:Uma2 family endonuclease